MTTPSRAKRIADLNDEFRKSLVTGGRSYMTAGVNAKGADFVAQALGKVIAFDDFNADNDPHGEHDFGSFELDGEKLFWKIDYYSTDDPDLGSEDPSDPAKTERVLTVMLAEEY
jgi:Protein of unknown function (DUF3768)